MKKKSLTPKLCWTQREYLDNGCELPDSLIHDNIHTEGELLSRDEIEAWLRDTQATFALIKERDENRFEELWEDYCTDVDYLVKIGSLTHEESEAVKNKDLYSF